MPKSKGKTSSPPDAITVAQAALVAGVTKRTIIRHLHAGYLRGYKKGFGPTSDLMVYRDSFEEYLRKREINPDNK